jgi:hypothetical protein
VAEEAASARRPIASTSGAAQRPTSIAAAQSRLLPAPGSPRIVNRALHPAANAVRALSHSALISAERPTARGPARVPGAPSIAASIAASIAPSIGPVIETVFAVALSVALSAALDAASAASAGSASASSAVR